MKIITLAGNCNIAGATFELRKSNHRFFIVPEANKQSGLWISSELIASNDAFLRLTCGCNRCLREEITLLQASLADSCMGEVLLVPQVDPPTDSVSSRDSILVWIPGVGQTEKNTANNDDTVPAIRKLYDINGRELMTGLIMLNPDGSFGVTGFTRRGFAGMIETGSCKVSWDGNYIRLNGVSRPANKILRT